MNIDLNVKNLPIMVLQHIGRCFYVFRKKIKIFGEDTENSKLKNATR
jgi:hypothetical protein